METTDNVLQLEDFGKEDVGKLLDEFIPLIRAQGKAQMDYIDAIGKYDELFSRYPKTAARIIGELNKPSYKRLLNKLHIPKISLGKW